MEAKTGLVQAGPQPQPATPVESALPKSVPAAEIAQRAQPPQFREGTKPIASTIPASASMTRTPAGKP